MIRTLARNLLTDAISMMFVVIFLLANALGVGNSN